MGDRLERELLLESFEAAGYERTETVVEVGQWSVRGGIVDVFAPSHPSPVRLEFFGDDVESIRRFDPTSQRSTDALDELLVLPLRRAGRRRRRRRAAAGLRPGRRAGDPRRAGAARRDVGGGAGPPAAARRARRPAVASSWRRWPGTGGRDTCSTRRRCRGSPRTSPSSPRRSGAGAPRASRCAWWPATSTRPSTCVRSCATTTSRRPSRRRSTRPSRSRSWWGSARRAS